MNNLTTKILSFFSSHFKSINAKKKQIRTDIRWLKKGLSVEQKQAEADAVFREVESLPEFINAETILFYWAMPDELPTQSAIKKWCDKKNILLPSIDQDKLVLKNYDPTGILTQKNLGIWEPDLVENYEGKVDLVIVPGIAFDKKKNRLGRGKGYYDRFFKKYKPAKIGVAFDCQLLDAVPIAKHDIKMDKVITPSEIIQ